MSATVGDEPKHKNGGTSAKKKKIYKLLSNMFSLIRFNCTADTKNVILVQRQM